MITINLAVQGVATDTPWAIVDDGVVTPGQLVSPNVMQFPIVTDKYGWQFHIRRANGYSESAVLPLTDGTYTGVQLGLSPLVYADPAVLLRLRTEGDQFLKSDGSRFWWKGATDMYLPARQPHLGDDPRPMLRQRRECGANLVGSLSMVDWDWLPWWGPRHTADYWMWVRKYFDITAEEGLYLQWTIFAGTRRLMPDLHEQQDHYAQTLELIRQYAHVLPDLLNEEGHPSQSIDPSQFERPHDLCASHGSGLTDADPVRPLWSWTEFHARRDAPPDTRGFTNYDAYEFQAVYPKECPYIPGEGMKPGNYRYNPAVAAQMGQHCKMHNGGTFHTTEGATDGSVLWGPQVEACARAFFAEIP